jgi:hypothetical protein
MFKLIRDLENTGYSPVHWMIRNIEAFDPDRQLAMRTTRGKPKYDPKWIVIKVNAEHRHDGSKGMVKFRAASVEDAVKKANTDKRLINRINKAFGGIGND